MSLWPLGFLIEGVLEQDPMTDKYVIRSTDGSGKSFDVEAALASLKGEEVRLTLASADQLAQLAKMVEAQGGDEVAGVYVSED